MGIILNDCLLRLISHLYQRNLYSVWLALLSLSLLILLAVCVML